MSDLRDVMRTFPQGVVVVTAIGDEGPRGITVSSFISVSLTPPHVLISIMNESRAHEAISRGAFRVNVLAENQGAVSDHFASSKLSSEEQFAPDSPGAQSLSGSDLPKVPGCLGYLECKVVNQHDGGDHTLFIGEVTEADTGEDGKPLLFYSRGYWGLGETVHER